MVLLAQAGLAAHASTSNASSQERAVERVAHPRDAGDDVFEELLAAAQMGAAWAIAGLYERHQPSILRYLTARVPRDAEDVASQVWLDASRGIDRFQGDETGFRCWLFVIARRRAANERRRLGRTRTGPDGYDRVEHQAQDDPELEAINRLASNDAVRLVIRLLPRQQARVVLLRFVSGFSVADTAAVVNKRPGAVRVIQHRALRTLKEKLERRVTNDDVVGIQERR